MDLLFFFLYFGFSFFNILFNLMCYYKFKELLKFVFLLFVCFFFVDLWLVCLFI